MAERFLVTGGAGFIGSSLVRALLDDRHQVTVLDDLSSGRRANLDGLDPEDLRFVEGSITDPEALSQATAGANGIFHLAAVASVPRSVDDPAGSAEVNVRGTAQVILAAKRRGIRRIVVASSSAIYGDNPALPLTEAEAPRPLSPYAAEKLMAEHYAGMAKALYGVEVVCLRFFNVYGPRQDPNSDYAAVIPKFIDRLLSGRPPIIFGDGHQSRDFTYVGDVVRATRLAMEASGESAGRAYNIACGDRRSLLELAAALQAITGVSLAPVHEPARAGDVRHSQASIERARGELGFEPSVSFEDGLADTVAWYRAQRG